MTTNIDLLKVLKQMKELEYEFSVPFISLDWKFLEEFGKNGTICKNTVKISCYDKNKHSEKDKKYYEYFMPFPNILYLENDIIGMLINTGNELDIEYSDSTKGWDYRLYRYPESIADETGRVLSCRSYNKDRLIACCRMWCAVKKVNSQERVTDHCSSCKNIKEGFKKLKKVTDNLDTKSKVDPKKLDKPMEL